MTSDPSRPRLFGIGLSRTGTLSLTSALSVLGWQAIHFPQDRRTFEQLAAGDFHLDIFERYDAVTDTPVVPYFPQFAELYPAARFILTIRDEQEWLTSCDAFWRRDWEDQLDEYHQFINTAVYGVRTFASERFRHVARQHHRKVQEYFADAPQRLLTINLVREPNWGMLCEFLGVPVPDVPFPHENRGQA